MIIRSVTAMERATQTTKSFIIALALVKKHLTVEEAALAAQVEVASQIQRWGEVEDCKSPLVSSDPPDTLKDPIILLIFAAYYSATDGPFFTSSTRR
jgi:hypothetical protein